jgi:hypothetical protein
MKEYHYHPEYKYFEYETDAYPSPREPGKYLLSANATNIVPPETTDGFIPIFDGNSWVIIEDNRGLYYCKDSLSCSNVEDPSFNDDNFTTIPPPLEKKLDNEGIKWCCDSNNWVIENLQGPEEPELMHFDEENPLENMSVEEKLSIIGLTVDDLKSLLSNSTD